MGVSVIRKLSKVDYSAEIFHLLRAWYRSINSCLSSIFWRFLSNLMGVQVGRHVRFNGPITIDRFKHSMIIIGDNCTFNSSSSFNRRGIGKCILQTGTDFAKIQIGSNSGFSGVSIVSNVSVTIGSSVMVGANTRIGDTDDHPDISGAPDAPIEIGNNVFIGMNCLILKGVTIGKNSIIAAGSVVTKDIPANCVAGGVPCKIIRINELN